MTASGTFRHQLNRLADEQGLHLLGVVSVGQEHAYPEFKRWLEEGRHGGMHYLENHGNLRENPAELLPGACSAIVLAMPYNQGDRLLAGREDRFRIAQYARIRDYHRSLRHKIEKFAARLLPELPGAVSFRITVDSAPLLEKAMAAKTHRGFIGKNTLYIHPEYGSMLLLGELLLSVDLRADCPSEVDPAERKPEGGCGSCRRCQVWCPTGALDEDYRIDARRCLSYLTIEHRGVIAVRYWKWLEHYFFGCDICQLACPWNRGNSYLVPGEERKFQNPPDPVSVVKMSQQEYEQWFGGTPLTRAKKSGLKRNALIYLVVTDHPALSECISYATQEGEKVVLDTITQIPEYRIFSAKEKAQD